MRMLKFLIFIMLFSIYKVSATDAQLPLDSIGNITTHMSLQDIENIVGISKIVDLNDIVFDDVEDLSKAHVKHFDPAFAEFMRYLRIYHDVELGLQKRKIFPEDAVIIDRIRHIKKETFGKLIAQADSNSVYVGVAAIKNDKNDLACLAPILTSVLDKCIQHANVTGDMDVLKCCLSQRELNADALLIPYRCNNVGTRAAEDEKIHTCLVSMQSFLRLFSSLNQMGILAQLSQDPQRQERIVKIVQLIKDSIKDNKHKSQTNRY